MSEHEIPEPVEGYSFNCEGRAHDLILGEPTLENDESNGVRTTRSISAAPECHLEAELEQVAFIEYGVHERVLRLRNTGDADTPVIADIYPLDIVLEGESMELPTPHGFRADARADFFVHYHRGSNARRNDFEPRWEALGTKPMLSRECTLSAGEGRSSNRHLPFFNLQTGPDCGWILAVGWSGQWHAVFELEEAGRLRLRIGMEKTHLALRPGETIRTPRVAILPWKGDRETAHNRWRRFLRAHHSVDGARRLPVPPVWTNTWFVFDSGRGVNDENQKECVTAASKLGVEHLVVDAGWYECDSKWWDGVGNWEPRAETFPDGFAALAEHGAENDVGVGVWFEPERVQDGTRLATKHPDWILPKQNKKNPLGVPGRLLNMGIPAAQDWFIELADRYIKQGLNWFRHDYNINPLSSWRGNDAPDRQGMTEIRAVEGLYRVYEEIHKRHPDVIIEGCASGGRRIDLETISRNHGYWGSDLMCGTPEPIQARACAMNHYLHPVFNNTCLRDHNIPQADTPENRYVFFSIIGSTPVFAFDVRDQRIDVDLAKSWVDLLKRVRGFTMEDFYPLTEWSLSTEVWLAMQFHEPLTQRGLVVAFRRPDCPYPIAQFPLRALESAQQYVFKDEFNSEEVTHSGAELAEGLKVALPVRPDVAIHTYRPK